MTQPSTPELKQVETALQLSPDTFAQKNYYSVFDVVRQSRKQFANESRAWLGGRGGKAWDLCMGQAQHIRRLFQEKKLTRQVRQNLPRTLSGQPVRRNAARGGIQGLVQDGPDWQNQFTENWQLYCQAGAPEAYDSPVSYLTWLNAQAEAFEHEIALAGLDSPIISLETRRPDLNNMMVDNDAINQTIPALQLVNEILESSIAGSLPDGKTVDETLAATRYPTLLPYHFPHDQTELSLLNAGVPLEDIIGQTSTDWPWFLSATLSGARSNNATELASRLAPEQQTIITEPQNTASTAFYTTNFGLATADYTPFVELDTFACQQGISVPQVEQLLAGNAGGAMVTLSPNVTAIAPSELSISSGCELTSGRFGSALSLFNAKGSYALFLSDGATATAMKGDHTFAINMWVYISAKPGDHQMPIIANNLLDSGSQGINLCVNNGCFNLEVTDSDGNTASNDNLNSDKSPSTVTYNVWYHLYLCLDIESKICSVDYLKEGDSSSQGITVDISTMTGDITTKDGFTWVLNDSGDLSYYEKYPVPSPLVNCLYDDIGVFDGTLAPDNTDILLSASVPLPQVTGLDQPYMAYYALDNICFAAAENYGASFINQNQSPAIALTFVPEFSSTYPDDKNTTVSLTANNVRQTPGRFGPGIFTAHDLASECYIPQDLSIKDGKLTDFSLVLWFKVSEGDAKTNGVIATNKTGTYAESGRGISVFFNVTTTGECQLYLNISDGSSKLNSIDSGDVAPVNYDEWTLVALVVDTTDNTINLYRGSASDTGVTAPITLDYSTINPLTSTDGSWGFNGNKGNTFYHSYSSYWSTVSFDDIPVWENALTETEIDGFFTSGAAGGGYTSMTHHYLLDAPDTPPAGNDLSDHHPVELFYLSDARMDRINRIVRLQRWLGLSFEETDLLLSACIAAQGGNNTDYSLNSHTLRALGVFRHWQQKYAINAFQFAAVLHQLTPYALSPAVPFFDQVFNSPSLFDKPFTITGATIDYTDKTGDNSLTVRQICAGLGITQAQFRVLADKVAAQLGDASKTTFPLTLDTVSAFYRLAMIPRWLGLTFADGAALFSLLQPNDAVWTALSGIPQLATLASGQPTDGGDILDILMALDAAADWAKDHSLSWLKNYLDLHATPSTLFASAATVNFVNNIKQQLPASVLSEQSFTGVLQPDDMTTGWMDILTSLIDANGLVLPAATDYDTIASLVSGDIDTAKLTYDSDADRSQAISTLTGIIFQAKLTQNGIADSALSQMFNTPQSLSAFLLQWASDSEYRLLSDSLTMNGTADITDPTTITGDYLGYLYNLGQRAGIATQFNLTPAAISVFLTHPDWLDAGYADLTLSLSLLHRFSRYGDWLVLASKEDAVLAYLSWVNTATPPATATAPTPTTAPTAATASAALAVLLDWDSSEVALATGALDDDLAKTVAEVDYVMRLKSLSAKTGLSVTPLLDTGALVPGNVSDTWDAWHSAGESLVAAWTDAN